MKKVTQKSVLIFLALIVALSGFGFTSKPANSAKCAYYHTVWYGETLYRIGLQYGMTWDNIASANKIKKPGTIYAGQVLCIPYSTQYGTGGPYTGYNYYNYNYNYNYYGYNYYGVGGPYNYNYYGSVPVIAIASVKEGKSVTVTGYYFPKNTKFKVLMGNYGTAGVGGIKVGTISTGKKTTFTATYKIPAALKKNSRIAIRFQSTAGGYYSYNWFYN